MLDSVDTTVKRNVIRCYSIAPNVIEVRANGTTRTIDFGDVESAVRAKMIADAISRAVQSGYTDEQILSGGAFPDRKPPKSVRSSDARTHVLNAIISVRANELWANDQDNFYASYEDAEAVAKNWVLGLTKDKRDRLKTLPSVRAAILLAKSAQSMDDFLAYGDDELVDA